LPEDIGKTGHLPQVLGKRLVLECNALIIPMGLYKVSLDCKAESILLQLTTSI
jgi:hypothetical protein